MAQVSHYPRDMALTPDQERLVSERYGVAPSSITKRRNQAIAAIAGIIALIAGTWWFSSSTFNPVSFEVVSFEVVDEWQIRIEFEVSSPVGTELSCDLQALDSSFGVVGHKTVSLAPSPSELTRYSVDLRTTGTAVSGVVDICRAN